MVTEVAGGTATGITVGSISNSVGTISATLAASCTATAGTVRFQVSDGSLSGTGDLNLNVELNEKPTLGSYDDTLLTEGGGTVVSPDAVPTDNGSVDSISATVLPVTFAGTLGADLVTGDVTIAGASPIDSYVITVTVTDNCEATEQSEIKLEVIGEVVFKDGFEE